MSRTWRWLWSTRPPDPWPKGAVTCPDCGRAIPGATRPTARPKGFMGGPIATNPTVTELADLCPVDGPLGAGLEARPIDTETTAAALVELATTLDSAGELRWASMLSKAAKRRDPVHMGHAVAILLRRGPQRTRRIEGVDDVELRQLLLDVVSSWPSRHAS